MPARMIRPLQYHENGRFCAHRGLPAEVGGAGAAVATGVAL